MITFNKVTLQQGSKLLFEGAQFSINQNMKVGLVGRNGSGKTSLFNLILQNLEPSAGDINFAKNITIAAVEQEVEAKALPALDFVASGDSIIYELQQQIEDAELNDEHEQLMQLHLKMADLDGYSVSNRAAKIMHGLGFAETELQNPVASFSGGWRMRLNIARCLMERSDLLLLDEPTNHLDVETVYWLEKHLKRYAGCLVVISHDREFLDEVCNRIVHIEHKKIKLYSGNYTSFEKQRLESIQLQNAMFAKQQAKINHMMSYVNRFRAKPSKAKQAQSRLKAIDKLELISRAQLDSPFYFEFKDCPKAPTPMIKLYKAELGYKDADVELPIISKVSFNIEPGDRIGLLGKNGAGKSTLIKSLTGDLPVLSGEHLINNKTKIGYFHQNLIDYLDLDKSPLEMFVTQDKKAQSNQVRSFLGGFNFANDTVLQKIAKFSGGEKTRLALAWLVWQQPNLLLLDEPTNHLDIEMRESLAMALQGFTGAVVVVSHDQHLLQTTVDKLYFIKDHTLQEYRGDLLEYLKNQ